MPLARTSGLPSPLPKSPLREKFGQQLSVATEVDSVLTTGNDREALRGRLNQGWQRAVAKFKEDTGKDLGDFRGGKNGVLGTLRNRYAEDNEDTKRKDELWAAVDKALNCVEFIGNIAAQVGSMVFQPASVCFGALETLINIPQAFKKLRDSLQGLFNQIVNFLTNFQILERVDNQLGLDIALVEKTNDILLAMVDICRLSNDVPRHKFLTVMGNIFLKDDKVQAALDNFRDLIEEQNKLTATITLEAALQTRATTQTIDRTVTRIGHNVDGISVKMDYIQAFQTDDKNLKANQEKITDIDNAFGVSQTIVRQPLHSLEQCRSNLLDDTMNVFAEQDLYNEWSRSTARRKLLFLQGEKGSGRTYLLAALNRDIYHQIDGLTKDDHKIYIAYYAFRREDGATDGNDSTPLRIALGVMASQIARQSDVYTKTLHKNLDAIKDARKLEDFYSELRLDSFEAPADSTLYLFFDGLDLLKTTSLKDLRKALDPAVSATDRSMKTGRKLRTRVIFTGNRETADSMGPGMPTIDVKELNEPLLRSFVEHEMASMLRDGLVLKQSTELTEAILKHATGSFTGVRQRLETIKNAVSMDLDFEELLVQLQSNKDSTSLLAGAEILDKVCLQLSSEHQQQLKEILYWAIFGLSWLTIEELEAALFLRRQRESLEPLKSKIVTRFAPAVILIDDKVMANGDVDQYVRDADTASTGPAGPSRITLEMKIENVDESIVKKFFWDLNNAIATDRFDFTSGLKQSEKSARERLRFSYAEAHYTMATRCLQALNDEKLRSKTASLLSYACRNLPNHLYYLMLPEYYDSLSPAQRRDLGQGVLGFLADMECMDLVWSSSPIWSWPWMYDLDNVRAIGKLLTDPVMLHELDPRDRRMAERMTRQTRENPIPFFENLAKVAASRWLVREKAIKDQEVACFLNVNAYIILLNTDLASLRFQSETEPPDTETKLENGSPGATAGNELVQSVQAKEAPTGGNGMLGNAGIAQDETCTSRSPPETNDTTPNVQPRSELQETATSTVGESGSVQRDTNSELPGEEVVGGPTDIGRSNEDKILSADNTHTDGGIDVDPVADNKDPIDPERVTADAIKVALDWSLKQLGLEPDYFIFRRLGNTLVEQDTAAAIEYLKQAYDTAPATDLGERLKAACALADAHARNNTTEAYNVLAPVIEESRRIFGETAPSDDEKAQLCITLTKAAGYLTDKQDDTGAVSILEDALVYSPNDGQCRHDLIRLLCKTNRSTRAQELFDQWVNMSTDDRSRGPQAHFLEIIRTGEYVTLCTFFFSTWLSPLHPAIVRALTVAIEYDGDGQEYSNKSALHFARGLALAITREDEALQTAVKEWESCIEKSDSTTIDDSTILSKSSLYAAQYYFDQYRKQLQENPQMSITEKTAMCEQLQDIVENIQVRQYAGMSAISTSRTYVAALARLAGLDSYARVILRPEMAMAIRVLRDEDPENDSYGLGILIGVLRCYDDIPGLCSVWSLYDRKKLAGKRKERWAAQLSNGDPGTNGVNDAKERPESTPQVTINPPDNDDATTTSGIATTTYTCYCDGCNADMESSTEQEIWSCTFCPVLDFCATCYKKLKNKELDRLICGHDHVHVLTQHFDYDQEEVEGDNVRIDWRITGSDEGGKARQREGGRIVELKDWVDILAHDWGVTRMV